MFRLIFADVSGQDLYFKALFRSFGNSVIALFENWLKWEISSLTFWTQLWSLHRSFFEAFQAAIDSLSFLFYRRLTASQKISGNLTMLKTNDITRKCNLEIFPPSTNKKWCLFECIRALNTGKLTCQSPNRML